MILTLVAGCGVDPSLPDSDSHDPTLGDTIDPCEVPGNICTWLGVPEQSGFSEDGTLRQSKDLTSTTFLSSPMDIAFGADGAAWYVDFGTNRIRKVSAEGIVTTVSGTGWYGDGVSGTECWDGCDAMESGWWYPGDVTPDPHDLDVLWVAAWYTHRVNRIDLQASTMSWWSGTSAGFFRDGPRREAIFNRPSSLVVAPDGSLIVADMENHVIRRIHDDVVTTIAGEPRMPGYGGDAGPASDAHLHGDTHRTNEPTSRLALDDHRLYVTDTVNGVVRTIDLDRCGFTEVPYGDDLHVPTRAPCTIEHFAGRYESAGTMESRDPVTGEQLTYDSGSVSGYAGDGGDADDAVFNAPSDVAIGKRGEVYVVDRGNHCVRVIQPDHTIETLAGQCTQYGFAGDGGLATEALLASPLGVAVDSAGDVYIADTSNQVIRRVRVPREE